MYDTNSNCSLRCEAIRFNMKVVMPPLVGGIGPTRRIARALLVVKHLLRCGVGLAEHRGGDRANSRQTPIARGMLAHE